MPSKSTRRQAIEEMVTVLQTIDGTSPYFRDLTVTTSSVSMVPKLIEDMVTEGNSWITVIDGDERIDPVSVTDLEYESRLDVLLICVTKDKSSETSVEEVNDLIHDVHLAVGANHTLNGTVDDAYVSRVDPPTYDLEDHIATVGIHVEVRYTFTAGTTT